MVKKGILEKYENKVFEETPRKMDGVQLQEPSTEAAPVTVQDMAFVRGGSSGPSKTLPAIAGSEGVGIVVSSGGGILGWNLVGKRVALLVPGEQRDGSWANYVTAPVDCCISIEEWDEIPIDISCRMFSLPMTAMNMLNEVRGGKHKACIQTDAAGPLGRMFLRLAAWEKVPTIHIVFRKDEGDILRNLGATYVLCTEDDTFIQNLRSLSKALGATIAFDGMGGELPGKVLSAMTNDSTMCLIGSYDSAPCNNIAVSELIQKNKSVRGISSLEQWSRNQGLGIFSKSPLSRARELFLCEVRDTEVSKRVELEDFFSAFETLEEIMKADLPGMPRRSVVVTPNPPREIWDKVIEKKQKEREAQEAFEKAKKLDQERLKQAKKKEEKEKERKAKKGDTESDQVKPAPETDAPKKTPALAGMLGGGAKPVAAAAGGAAAGGGLMSMIGKLKEQQKEEEATTDKTDKQDDTKAPQQDEEDDDDVKEPWFEPAKDAPPPMKADEKPEEPDFLASLGFGNIGNLFGAKEEPKPEPTEPPKLETKEGDKAEKETETPAKPDAETPVQDEKPPEEPGFLDTLGLGGVADFFSPPSTTADEGADTGGGGGFFDFLSGPSTAASADGADGGGGGGFFDFLTGPSTAGEQAPEAYVEEETPAEPSPATFVSTRVSVTQLDVPDFHEDVRDSDDEEEEDEDEDDEEAEAEEEEEKEEGGAEASAGPAPVEPAPLPDPMALPDLGMPSTGAGGLPDPMAMGGLPDPVGFALPDPTQMEPSFEPTM